MQCKECVTTDQFVLLRLGISHLKQTLLLTQVLIYLLVKVV